MVNLNEVKNNVILPVPDQKPPMKQRTWLLTLFGAAINALIAFGLAVIMYKYPWIRVALRESGMEDLPLKFFLGSQSSMGLFVLMEKFKDTKTLQALYTPVPPPVTVTPSVPAIIPEENCESVVDDPAETNHYRDNENAD